MNKDINEDFYRFSGNYTIQPNCIVGLKYREECAQVTGGDGIVIRSGCVIYADVTLGDDFQAGHNVTIRENTTFGNHIVVGTNTVIDGNVQIGDFVKIESNCYIPTNVTIGNRVFLGPNVVLTNDKYPLKLRDEYKPIGPIISSGVTLGAGVIVCPGVEIGENSFVAAGCVVTKSVPANSFVKGMPSTCSEMPEKLNEVNMALSWRKYFD